MSSNDSETIKQTRIATVSGILAAYGLPASPRRKKKHDPKRPTRTSCRLELLLKRGECAFDAVFRNTSLIGNSRGAADDNEGLIGVYAH